MAADWLLGIVDGNTGALAIEVLGVVPAGALIIGFGAEIGRMDFLSFSGVVVFVFALPLGWFSGSTAALEVMLALGLGGGIDLAMPLRFVVAARLNLPGFVLARAAFVLFTWACCCR
jgi:hypothetical protein